MEFVLTHRRAPGDTLVMTALVRDIAKTYPDKYKIAVDVTASALFANNPYICAEEDIKNLSSCKKLKLDYGDGINIWQRCETIHFLAAFYRDFTKKTGIIVPVTEPKPDLHLSKEEKEEPLIDGRYWVVMAGGKSDYPVKVWSKSYYQKVVDQIRDMGLGVVQVGAADSGHWHHELDGVLDLIGRTHLRDLIRIIYHSEGVICGITLAMHMAAALERPCVCIAGGREAWYWEAYVNENKGFGPKASGKLKVPHRYLHTIGLLDCCKITTGCWKNKVVSSRDTNVCQDVVDLDGQKLPKCMEMITPNHVMAAVESYYADGTLPMP